MWFETNNRVYGRTNNAVRPVAHRRRQLGRRGRDRRRRRLAVRARHRHRRLDPHAGVLQRRLRPQADRAASCPARASSPRRTARRRRMLATGPLCRRAEDLLPLAARSSPAPTAIDRRRATMRARRSGRRRASTGSTSCSTSRTRRCIPVSARAARRARARGRGAGGGGRAHPARASLRRCAARSRSGRRARRRRGAVVQRAARQGRARRAGLARWAAPSRGRTRCRRLLLASASASGSCPAPARAPRAASRRAARDASSSTRSIGDGVLLHPSHGARAAPRPAVGPPFC